MSGRMAGTFSNKSSNKSHVVAAKSRRFYVKYPGETRLAPPNPVGAQTQL
jgi:hypothetical protein